MLELAIEAFDEGIDIDVILEDYELTSFELEEFFNYTETI